MTADISPDFRLNKSDSATIKKILPFEGTPEAVKMFDRYCYRLTNYGYWFLLSTLWVNYTGWSDLDLWKKLFSSTRDQRETSIMKPSELRLFRALPDSLPVLRAHRPGEKDWIAYTLSVENALMFACKRGVDEIRAYVVNRSDVLALFTRRGENEVLILDKSKVEYVQTIKVVVQAK